MREIPKDLKFEIVCNMYDGIVNDMSFFKDKDKEFLTSIALFLQPFYFSKKDVIISQGDLVTDIYFILHGTVNIISGEDEILFKTLGEGQEFGDIEVLLKLKRVFSAVAACEVTLLVMRENYIKKIKNEFPGI